MALIDPIYYGRHVFVIYLMLKYGGTMFKKVGRDDQADIIANTPLTLMELICVYNGKLALG